MVKNMKALSFSDRKYNFGIMMHKLRIQNLDKNQKPDSGTKNHTKTKLDKNLIKDPEKWNKFQKKFQDEFENKIKLMEEIRQKKMENILIKSIYPQKNEYNKALAK